jgi:xanthine dehydrogenase small subunit
MAEPVAFRLNGDEVAVPRHMSLLDALREHLGVRSAKDGCSPQGQCGCCTVWVDGQPRVACVTPVARVSGRAVTTIEGLADADRWGRGFCSAGASQCGFCTPGIIMRLAALDPAKRSSPTAVRQALLAHLCRCTGWQTIVEVATGTALPVATPAESPRATARAELEGGVPQDIGSQVSLGRGGFADDLAPPDALVALRGAGGQWVVGSTLAEARAASGKVQGRRSTAPLTFPIDLPDGKWARTLRTTWVEPGYLEPDASWCVPGGEPASPLGNGGAFGGKVASEVAQVARRLADEHQRAVRVLSTREDVVRYGPKRPPMAIGLRADGTGVARVARTPGIADAIRAVAPGVEVIEVEVAGPPTSAHIRGAGWAEVTAALSSLRDGRHDSVTGPSGATATAWLDEHDEVHVRVSCGVAADDELETAIARSYVIGAAHMALGWVRSEAIAVDADGHPLDLTIRSFGIMRAIDTPAVHVEFDHDPAMPAVNGSDAAFAAVAAAAWRHAAHAPQWPVEHRPG